MFWKTKDKGDGPPPKTLRQPLSPKPPNAADAPAVAEATEVWVPDKERVWVRGRVTRQVGRSELEVETEDGVRVAVDLARHDTLHTANPSAEQDMCSLWHMSEPAVLSNLQLRFAADQPYTYVAHLLIAVNPLKPIPDPAEASYEGAASSAALAALPPHQFAVAERAYRALLARPAVGGGGGGRQDQSIVVSGESGAGKTESAKKLLRYITWRVASAAGGTQHDRRRSVGQTNAAAALNARILDSSPILESLGNAKTVRNHNSSRFGKFTKIDFDARAAPKRLRLVGASVETYLLERSRVTRQAEGERNYHIFYQLLAGASAAERQRWRLPPAASAPYVSGCVSVPTLDDAAGYAEFCEALGTFDAKAEEREALFLCLSALLHLGNVDFSEAASPVQGGGPEVLPVDPARLQVAAELLGLEPAALLAALTTRTVTALAHGESESFSVRLDGAKTRHARDNLAKAVYSALFDWAVGFVNGKLGALAAAAERDCFIGILDIFGFESFLTNGFEQLLINFANEKLQATFNQHVFAAEQELYAAEGIAWRSVRWPDNSETIGLIASKERGRAPGVLHLLDETSRLPNQTDADFNKRVHDAHGAATALRRPDPRARAATFAVRHYAGDVTYTAAGFLDRNNGTVSADLVALLGGSAHTLLAAAFAAAAAEPGTPAAAAESFKSPTPRRPLDLTTPRGAGGGAPATPRRTPGSTRQPRGVGGGKVFSSVGLTFVKQMSALVAELDSTRCNFVRCIKPNPAMAAGVFDAPYTVTQLRHTGMLQCCELLKHGFPTRISYAEVVERYAPHLPPDVGRLRLPPRDFAAAVAYGFGVQRDLYQLGATRLFFRAGGVACLDGLRTCDMAARGPEIVARVRRWIVLRRFRRALAHTRAGLRLCRLLRRVRALALWRAALLPVRAYLRSGLRQLARRLASRRAAVTIQAAARMAPHRRAFVAACAHLIASRAEAQRQAALSAAAVVVQAAVRRRGGRRELERRRRERLVVLTPRAISLQRWWRVVRGDKIARKLRSVVDRASAEHRSLVAELLALRAACDESDARQAAPQAGPPDRASGAKRFEMWVSLQVGLPAEAEQPPAFTGTQIFSARSAVLRRAGGYLLDFFGDSANVGCKTDGGHYRIERSWKHFEAVLDYVRDGSCALPAAYSPKSQDNRRASSEEEELREFVREAGFYRIRPLLDLATARLLRCRYSSPHMLSLLGERGLL